jgi:hypothetical protein
LFMCRFYGYEKLKYRKVLCACVCYWIAWMRSLVSVPRDGQQTYNAWTQSAEDNT